MFLAKPGEYPPCGIFTLGHLILFVVTMLVIIVSIKFTKIKEKEDVKKIIKISTIVIWILEILKIAFVFSIGNGNKINKVVPLYYCSLLLYAGVLSSVGKGVIKKIGDVFLATGAIAAGFIFLLFPTTSLPEYPMLHFLSLHSFVYHGLMIYIGIIINKSNYIEIKKSDIKYYSLLIVIISILAYILNSFYGSNLMFISEDFPGTPITIIYRLTGKCFTLVMVALQMTLPFYFVYWVKLLINKIKLVINK